MSLTASAPSAPDFRPETPNDAPAVEALLDHAFGPGRFVKVSERVREFALFRPDLSLCVWDRDTLLGSVRMSQVNIGGAPAMFLGPLAVHTEQRRSGLGGQLVARACAASEAAGFPVVLLVGDEPYFARFSFSAAPAAAIVMPGPVDRRRLLVRGASAPLVGTVTA